MREDPIEVLQKIFAERTLSKNIENELVELVQSLYKDLQSTRDTNSNLRQQILDLLQQETFGITSKYTALKQAHSALNQQLAAVKNENDDLNTQLIAKNEELKKAVAEKEQEMHHHYRHLIKQKEEEIRQREDELCAVKQSYESRIQKLYAEMEATGAFSAMQLDQAEGSHRKQLSDVTMKLKESTNTCNILRNELFHAKEQCNEYKTKISELQRQLRQPLSSEASFRIQDKSWSNESNELATTKNNTVNETLWNNRLNNSGTPERSNMSLHNKYTPERNNTTLHSKYEPLQVACRNNISLNDRLLISKKPPTYRRSFKTSDNLSNYVKRSTEKNVPPTMNVSEGENDKEKQPVKKRKLYNPEDWTYLNADQGSLSQ